MAKPTEVDLLHLLNQNNPSNQGQPNDSAQQLRALLPQITAQPVDPVKESESASFITSLLSKTSLQGNIQPGAQNPYHPHLPVPFGMAPPPLQGNFYPPMGFFPPGVVKPNQYQPQDIPFPYPPNQPNGQPLPSHALPRQFPVQNIPMHAPPQGPNVNGAPQQTQEQTGLEKWFGAAIYQATPAPPLPHGTHPKMVSLEEIERKVVTYPPHPSSVPSSAPIPMANPSISVQQRIK
jgi:hypothetical protein